MNLREMLTRITKHNTETMMNLMSMQVGASDDRTATLPSPQYDRKFTNGLCQWTTSDEKRFIPASGTRSNITPGVYEINMHPQIGLYFEYIPVNVEGLVRFPQANSERVITEIMKFWDRGDLFREYKLTHKRGIMLYGPPGSGKSCTIRLLMADVIKRGGAVIKFTHPPLFSEGVRIFREIQPETPIVVLMEDLDGIIRDFNESQVLNILDGVDKVDRALFLATTNYPEQMGPRIMNRPSRFDKRFKIDHPNPESRRIYFEFIIGKERIPQLGIDLDKWIKDTEGFSIAHLQELFVAVSLLGDEYDEAIETLSQMKEPLNSADDEGNRGPMGLVPKRRHRRMLNEERVPHGVEG